MLIPRVHPHRRGVGRGVVGSMEVERSGNAIRLICWSIGWMWAVCDGDEGMPPARRADLTSVVPSTGGDEKVQTLR